MEGIKQKQLSNLLRRDDSLVGIIVAEKESGELIVIS